MNDEIKKRIADIRAGKVPEGYKKTKVGIVPVEWEENKLSSLFLSINSGKAVKNVENGIYPIYGSTGQIGAAKSYNYDDKIIIVARVGANAGSIYRIAEKCQISDNALAIRINDNHDFDFVYYLLCKINLNNLVFGSGQPLVTSGQIKKLTYFIPKIGEQQKIAEILSTQDKLIELQEKEIQQLKELKKAYLQKMFPKKGSKYPELRFNGFTDAWEERKISEIAECLDSMRVPLNSEERSKMQGDIPYYGAGNIQDYINQYLFDEELVLLLEDGDAFDDFKTKSIAQYVCGKSWVNNHAHILRAKGDTFFLYTSLAHKDIRNATQLAGASRKKLVQDAMLKIEISVPLIAEQKKIGDFFKNFNDIITLNQRKLEQEKQKKKALLQLLLTGIVRTK